MSDINNIIVIGNLTQDPVLRNTPNGHSVAVFSIASNHTYKKGDEKVQEATFIECNAWGKLAEIICQYSKKGHRLGVAGRLKQDRWEDDNGKARSKHLIVVSDFQFLTSKKESGNSPDPNQDVDWD